MTSFAGSHSFISLSYFMSVSAPVSALQKCKGYYNLGAVISVASVQRVLLYPHDYCVQTSHRDSNCYILLPELVVKDYCNHGKPRTDATQITIATLK